MRGFVPYRRERGRPVRRGYFYVHHWVYDCLYDGRKRLRRGVSASQGSQDTAALYAVTVLTYISALAMPSLFWTTVATAPNLLKSFFFLPYESRGGHILPVFPIGWTINYEMGFYILAAAAMKWFPKRKTWFMQASLLALVLAGEVFRPQNAVLKFWTSEILLEFCFGMFVFEAFKRFGKEAGCKKFRGGGIFGSHIIVLDVFGGFPKLRPPKIREMGDSCRGASFHLRFLVWRKQYV